MKGSRMSSTPVESDNKTEEVQRIYDHKFDNYVKILGPNWPLDDIRALIDSDVYYGELEDLLSNGCPKDVAIEILL